METTQILDTPATGKSSLEYASKGARFANYILDVIAFYALMFILLLVLGMVSPDIMLGMTDPSSIWKLYGFVFLLMIIFYSVFAKHLASSLRAHAWLRKMENAQHLKTFLGARCVVLFRSKHSRFWLLTWDGTTPFLKPAW